VTFLALDNPVMRAELRHQRHVISSSRSGWFWILLSMLMLVPALLAALVLIAAALFRVDLEPIFSAEPLASLGNLGVTSLMIMNFALYIVVTLVTLALAARSISREYESGTWDNLLLTNMTARQIVLGKWWATLRALWGDHLLVLALRLGFVTWLDFVGSDPLLPTRARLIPSLLVVIAFSLADSALTTILGILPPVSGRNPIVMTLALGIRFVVSAAILAVTIGIGLLLHEWNPLLVAAVIAGMAFYVLLTAAMIRFAEWAAVRNLVSPSRPLPQ
jgi:hypothetical protein